MATKILKWHCPRCGKSIESIFPMQLDYNVTAHKKSCEQKELKEK